MSDVVIHVDNLGKRYRIGERERYLALRDVLTRAIKAPARLFGPAKPSSSNGNGSGDHSHIWALKDVSFDILQGEVVGIIGRNGAGKSTLLKILARVTKPTSGHAEILGRMGTLLEVGTGFHPELSGRENVFLSGAILGMSKDEIRRKFDEIVDFAEVEKFIDTPLKHYSSGMQMRLAFAVAAHLEPEILLVDEVLSVGDVEFQKKCMGKMGDVAKTGRTILFVSHQMNQIRRLCDRVIWIDASQVREHGSTAEITARYESAGSGLGLTGRRGSQGTKAHFQSWEIVDSRGKGSNVFNSFGQLVLKFTVVVDLPIWKVHHGIVLYDSDRRLLWGNGFDGLDLQAGTYQFVYKLPTLPLRPGSYNWYVTLLDEHDWIDRWECVPDLQITTKPVTHRLDEWAGFLNIPCTFSAIADDAVNVCETGQINGLPKVEKLTMTQLSKSRTTPFAS
jgi:lipopolysaccharide transport system ATP-binding protein